MKTRIISSLIIAVAFIGSSVAQTSLTGSLTNGLLAEYQGGNTNDLTGNGYNLYIGPDLSGLSQGIQNTLSFSTDRFGKYNASFLFDGQSSWMTILNSQRFINFNNTWTISIVVNIYGSGRNSSVAFLNNGYDWIDHGFNFGYQIGQGDAAGYQGNLGTGFFVSSQWNGLGGSTYSIFTSSSVNTNKYYYVTATCDSKSTKIYVNSNLEINTNITLNFTSSNSLQIGRHLAGPVANYPGFYQTFNGKIDQLQIYNRALSSNEVASLYALESAPAFHITTQPTNVSLTATNSQTALFSVGVTNGVLPYAYQWMKDGVDLTNQTNASLVLSNAAANTVGYYSCDVTDQNGTTVTSSNATLNITGVNFSFWQGLVAYYPFDGDAKDYSGNGRDLTLRNSNTVSYSLGSDGTSLYLAGDNRADYLPPYRLRSNFLTNYSYSMWINPTSINRNWPEWTYLMSDWQGNGTLRFGDNTNSGTSYYNYQQFGYATIPEFLANQWQHLVITQRGSLWSLYFNGCLKASHEGAVQPFALDGFFLFNSGGYQYGYKGYVNEVRIYNRTLSSNEVVALYQYDGGVITPPNASPTLYVANTKGILAKASLTNTATSPFVTLPSAPFSLASDASGNVYAALPNKNSLYKITTNGAISTFTNSALNLPYGVALDPTGNLFAANFGNNAIVRISTNGAVTTYATKGINKPYALTFDSASNLYVANQGNSTVVRISTNGTSTTLISGMALPTGLAVDATGTVYVADKTRGTITRLPLGGYTAVFAYGLNQPTALALDPSGTLYAVNSGNNSVVKFSSNGVSSLVTTNGLSLPLSLTIAPGR